MFLPGDTWTSLSIGVILGMFFVALALFFYAIITSRIAYKRNEQELSKGLQAIREQYQKER